MMNFRQWIIREMPITAFNLHGNLAALKDKPFDKITDKIPGYEPSDVPFLTNQSRVKDLIKKWSNTKQNYELHFVSSEQAAAHVEVGEKDTRWIQKNLGLNIQKKPGVITVIFTNNQGLERVPLTPWIIAHRLGHVLEKAGGMKRFEKILDDGLARVIQIAYSYTISYQDKTLQFHSMVALHQLAAAIGTMKSAAKLTKYYEFPHELLAQYLQTGGIQFRNLPVILPVLPREAARYSAVGRPLQGKESSINAGDELLTQLGVQLQSELDMLLNKMVGKIFVM
jgi:hypothetical protein